MSKRESDGDTNEKLKQPKPNVIDPIEIAAAPVAAAAAAAAAALDVQCDGESPPAIFKLNAVCCDDLFDFLSLRDLLSLGQTCKRMQQLAGHYFQENYKGEVFPCGQYIYYDGNDYMHRYNTWRSIENDIVINEFISFVRRLNLEECDSSDMRGILEKCDSLQHLDIPSDTTITPAMFDCIKVNLDKIESICLGGHLSKIDSFEILKYSPNLKTLSYRIGHGVFTDWDEHDWMSHKYPKLEHLTLDCSDSLENSETGEIGDTENFEQNLRQFFQLNTSIKSFEISHILFMGFMDVFMKSGFQLDGLTITECNYKCAKKMPPTYAALDNLYDIGFFKRLRLEQGMFSNTELFTLDTLDTLDALGTVRGLEELSIDTPDSCPSIVNLKVLDIECGKTNFEVLPNKFPNLQRIRILYDDVSMDAVTPLIYRLQKLKELKINSFPVSENRILNLPALNARRKRLPGACKLTIYLSECQYLETKGAACNMYASHELIEVKRSNALV